jgi:uncharacterized protein DUF4154
MPLGPDCTLLSYCKGALSLFCACISISCLQAQTAKPSEYQVKAAYLYNFGKFVQWGSHPSEVKDQFFDICVLGKNPFGPALGNLAGQTINGHSVVPLEIGKAEEAAKCNVLFVGTSEEGHLNSILAELQKMPVLTVSDIPKFCARGGIIEFVVQDNRVRFEVNRTAADRAGLALSSDLLKVAVRVETNP